MRKPEGKSKFGRPGRRWEENVKMNLKQIGGDGVDWNDPAQSRDKRRALVNAVKNFRVNAGNFLTSYETVCFPRRTLPMELHTTDQPAVRFTVVSHGL